jgi:exosortase E/protease (VPEID-CTERM system)
VGVWLYRTPNWTARGLLAHLGLFTRHASLGARLAAAAGLLFLEKLCLNFFVDFSSTQAARGLGAAIRIAQHWGFRFVVTLAIALALFIYVRASDRLAKIDAATRGIPLRPKWLVLHVALLPPLAAASFLLYGDHSVHIPLALLVSSWLLLALAAVLALWTALAPWPLWRRAARESGVLLGYAALAAAGAASAMQWSQGLWTGMARITFEAVRGLLAPLIPNIQTDPSTLIIDTGHFAVEVSSVCSGLEGMGLMLAFCGVWLVLCRREYRFPRALLLIPAGLVLSFVLNVLRIATLVLIGHAGWPDTAVYGFHSQAGWITFNAAAGLIVYVSRRPLGRESPAPRDAIVETENPTAAYLVPFLAILAAGMLARAFSAGFETLYFLRPAAAAVALYWYWPKVAALDWSVSWRGAATGLMAFVVWAVGAHYFTQAMPIPTSLAAMPPALRIAWITIRTAASVVLVPVAEELAYRGYLLRRLVAADFSAVRFQSCGPWALVVSSVVFGLGHGSLWLPGMVTGLLYGALLIRTGRMGDAVVAHATTNAAVALSVLIGEQWQLW